MKRFFSTVRIHAPGLLLSLYVFSFWILPQDWNEDNTLDGSWRYALGMFRGDGFSLGKDSWFTYGPLAHWFGAPMGAEQYHPFPFYVLGFFVAGIIGISFARILSTIELPYYLRLISTIIFPFCFIGMDGVQEVHLIIALFMLLISCCIQETPDNTSMVSMVILSACGLLYKISFGMLSLFILMVLLASLFARKKIGITKIILYLAGYGALLYVLFVATSGSFDLITYILLGLETSNKYSEIMIRNMPYSPPNYIVAVVYIIAGTVLAWQASKMMAGKWAAASLMTAYLGAMLLLYKHGFVRADLSHMRLFYSCVTPFLAILAVVSHRCLKTKTISAKVLLWLVSLVFVLIYSVMLTFLPGATGPVHLVKNWLTCGNRIVAGIAGQSPKEFPAKRAFVKNSQPQLFAYLNEYGRKFGAKGREPRIAFYPWELLHFEGLEGFDLAPSPSLQLYSTGPHSRAHRLEAEFLSSVRRPDVVVIGPAAIDGRPPVSELTDLLLSLYCHYRVAAVVDGFTILEVSEKVKSRVAVIRYSETATGVAGEFLRISFDQPAAVNMPLWRFATTAFKSPELSVAVTLTYHNGREVQSVWRGYLSQLQGGVLFSPETVPDFFGSHFRTAAYGMPSVTHSVASIKSAVAELRRSDGFWNLPVIPQVVPLTVKYCSFM